MVRIVVTAVLGTVLALAASAPFAPAAAQALRERIFERLIDRAAAAEREMLESGGQPVTARVPPGVSVHANLPYGDDARQKLASMRPRA